MDGRILDDANDDIACYRDLDLPAALRNGSSTKQISSWILLRTSLMNWISTCFAIRLVFLINTLGFDFQVHKF